MFAGIVATSLTGESADQIESQILASFTQIMTFTQHLQVVVDSYRQNSNVQSKVHLQPCQTSMVELFAKIPNC